MKVTFTHSSGREQPMDERYAKVLQKMRRGTYMTRDIVSEPVTEPESPRVVVPDDAHDVGPKKRGRPRKVKAEE